MDLTIGYPPCFVREKNYLGGDCPCQTDGPIYTASNKNRKTKPPYRLIEFLPTKARPLARLPSLQSVAFLFSPLTSSLLEVRN